MKSLTELPFGAIKPLGWIKQQMQNDVDNGFVGCLDELVPDLICHDDIYDQNRLTKLVKSKNVGTNNTGHEWEVQFLWWNAETQSNWWDGYLRNLLLLEHSLIDSKLAQYIQAKLATADNNGYIGIYGEDLRYNHATENGELWAQAALFRGLLAWFEYTGEQQVLEAVIKAVRLTMEAYPINQSCPFKANDAFAGVGHGLTFVDVLESLHRITGEPAYLDYAVFLYDDYCAHPQPEEDIQLKNLLSDDYRFKGHGVHTYEHLRALTVAAYHCQEEQYQQGLAAYLHRLEQVVTAAGGPIGDEWIAGRHAHHCNTGYEFCSIQELFHSYALLLQKTGSAKWADKMERLFYNAAQGAKHPSGKSMAYCHSDNSFNVLGHLDMNNPQGEMRFKYSPAHQDVAVCCAPNAGRIYPYFVQNMWQRQVDGLVLNLFGPSVFNTLVNGVNVTIEQQTRYPFEHQVRLKIQTEKPVCFRLSIRHPEWANIGLINGEIAQPNNGYLVTEQQWSDESELVLTFDSKPEMKRHNDNVYGVHYGPLLYALPLEHVETSGREYPVEGFCDQFFSGADDQKQHWELLPDSQFQIVSDSNTNSWCKPPKMTGVLYDPNTKQRRQAELLPMGSTILRKVSFELAQSD